MATPISFAVLTVDSAGQATPEANAELVLGRRDLVGDSEYPFDDLLPTFSHVANGRYTNSTGDPDNEPGAGEWLLVVRKNGCSVVVQRLTLAESNGIMRASAGWGRDPLGNGLAASVSIVNFDAIKGKPAATQSVVTTRLFPAQRFVGVGCRDNHGGTRFTLFAQGRRDFLWDQDVINSGCVATLFDCLENVVRTTVKGSKAASDDWIVVASSLPKDSQASILDFYRFVDQVGQTDLGTLVEAGIFGHAWHQGPLVQDTFDHSTDLDVRDPNDADGRPKDWYANGTVATDFPNFKAAFQSGARMVVWGCSHMINVSAEAAECNRQVKAGTSRNQFFRVTLTAGGTLNTTLDYAAFSLAQNVVSPLKGRFPEQGSASAKCTYPGMMAQALAPEVTVFAAMPGAGANFGSGRGPTRPKKPQASHITLLVVDQGENLQLQQFYAREYGSFFERDGLKYLNYTKLLNAPLPNPGFSTQRFIRYQFDDPVADYLRLPSRLEVGRRVKAGGFDLPVPFTNGGEAGHLYVAKNALAIELQLRGADTLLILTTDPTRDSAFFVTTTGKTLLFERLAGTKSFVLPAVMPNLFRTVMVRDPIFKKVDGDPGQTLTGNLLEQVVPKCYW